MRRRSVIVACLVLLACDPVIRRTETAGPTSVETVNCSTTGICCKYGWSFRKGKLEFWCGVHIDCPGKQQVKVQHYTEVVDYQSGRSEQHEWSRNIEVVTGCER